jgi:ribokinase
VTAIVDTRTPRICMVGSSNTDLVARVPRLPHLGECLTGSSFNIGFGGKGANQAIMAARLGAHVAVVTRLGRDTFGEAYVRYYQEEGIDTRHIALDAGRSSGATLILVDEPTGLNTMAFVPGANGGLAVADVHAAREAITASDVLLCQLEVPIETTQASFRVAHEDGAGRRPMTILNVAPVPEGPLPGGLLELTDVLVANEEEAAYLVGRRLVSVDDTAAAAAELAARWGCAAVLTLGRGGAIHVDRGGTPRHVAAPVLQAVDTTGAGDAFVGSLGYLLATGQPLPLAVERAVGIASLTVMKPGTQASFPGRAEVRDALGW